MKVNDVLRRGGVTLRILAIRSNLVLPFFLYALKMLKTLKMPEVCKGN